MEHSNQQIFKKVTFNAVRQQHTNTTSTSLNLNDHLNIHKKIPVIKKFQSLENTDMKKHVVQDERFFDILFDFLKGLLNDKAIKNLLIKSVDFEPYSNHILPSKNSQKNFKKNTTPKKPKQRLRLSKKISIFLDDQDDSVEQEQDFLTESVMHRKSQVKFPFIQLTRDLIEQVFLAPSLFLINLSICLVLKYSHQTKTDLDYQNIGWILCISTIIAYKTYYDQPITDIVDYFSKIMNISNQQIIDIQRIYLEELDYRTIIAGAQYQYVVAKLLDSDKENILRA